MLLPQELLLGDKKAASEAEEKTATQGLFL